jgi:hypothetical protein
MRRYTLTAVIALLATVGLSGAGTSAISKEGVSSSSYAPKPFYNDITRLRIRFTTTGRARPGFEYLAIYSIHGPGSLSEKCASFGLSDEKNDVVREQTILGAAGRSYTVIFKPARFSSDFPVVHGFCPGRAFVEFTSASIAHPSKKTSRLLATLTFRVRKAQ